MRLDSPEERCSHLPLSQEEGKRRRGVADQRGVAIEETYVEGSGAIKNVGDHSDPPLQWASPALLPLRLPNFDPFVVQCGCPA